jgi:bifunctional non-homologous end joining protein LigD
VESGAFVIQQHDARRMHYDFRIEVDGVLKSWAVPRGPSTDPTDKRLAVPTEDHPLEYANYEGVIPEGGYGAGPSLLWDRGDYVNISHDRHGRLLPMAAALSKGHVSIWLRGEKLVGGWSLTRIENSRDGKEAWLLVKRTDAAADASGDITVKMPRSVASGLTIDQLRQRGRS